MLGTKKLEIFERISAEREIHGLEIDKIEITNLFKGHNPKRHPTIYIVYIYTDADGKKITNGCEWLSGPELEGIPLEDWAGEIRWHLLVDQFGEEAAERYVDRITAIKMQEARASEILRQDLGR